MRKLKLYIETSAWNFYFSDDAPEKKEVTIEFFGLVEKGIYDIYLAQVVLDEIDEAPEPIKAKLMGLIQKYQPIELESDQEAEALAKLYMDKGAIPAKKEEDALHVAIATVHEMDVLVTWNYKHLANVKKAELLQSINLSEGYTKLLTITTPMGVMTDED
ncbi:MAG: type II toxin-antitoxin system VapC family toxin [Candidatus Omnitrophica bacterium]|nr:type II toxin-antitoxin system VapC family toxin [Candidatus Omnitrophota bacterium]